MTKNEDIREQIKCVDKEINQYFCSSTASNVRRGNAPGNTGSLWKAVKTACDTTAKPIHNKLYLIPLRVKLVGEFIKNGHKKISPTRIGSGSGVTL
jgi:hypothetical protein